MKKLKLNLIVLLALLVCAVAVKAQSIGGTAWVSGNTNVFLIDPVQGYSLTNLFSQNFLQEKMTVGNLTNANQVFSCGEGYAIVSTSGGVSTTNWVFPSSYTNNCAVTGTNISGQNLFITNFPSQTVTISVFKALYFNSDAANTHTNNNTVSSNP